jgi:sulfoxide reductase heme-binding subunit YedZ
MHIPPWRNIPVHILAVVPLALTAYEYFTGALPIVLDRHLIIRFGAVGLAFIVAAFSITPLITITGKAQLVSMRRSLGVYGFCYIALHILVYAWISNGFDWALILRDLFERRAMSIGLLAFALLIPLALTSTNGWQKRLGRRWKKLHRLVYLAVPLGVLHYFLLDRDIKDWVLVYAALVGGLFAVRLPAIKRAVARRRQHLQRIASETSDQD